MMGMEGRKDGSQPAFPIHTTYMSALCSLLPSQPGVTNFTLPI